MSAEDTQDPLTQSQAQHTSKLKARKKKIYLMAIVLITIIYFGAALAFRAYRMDPRNQYYGFYLPSATPTHSTTVEESDKIIHALTREPKFLERMFYPAEFVLTSIGK
jgi:hypothetical protein